MMSETESFMIKIRFTSETGTIEVEVTSEDTVEQLKEKLIEKTNLKVIEQLLVFKGKILENNKKLSDYKIGKDHVMVLVRIILKLIRLKNKTKVKKRM